MRQAARFLCCLLVFALARPTLAAPPSDIVYGAAVTQCLVSEPAGPSVKRLHNLCTFRINITFCQIKRDGDDCAAGHISGTTMGAKTSRSLLEDVIDTHYVVCRDPFYLPQNAAAWKDGHLLGRCQASRSAIRAARRR
ncbi:hypothetical protein [Bordetella holmesii]|uniref:Lipoprotein n=2 Tax=Bordetella holmesii TaxID=35814 RepID=A0ABN0S1V9_9BORD|nr:hypothetical protein [Bordetella holmesii]AIT25724.1 putative lipoprotein [Bordetella holmesii 44057]EWM44222.1 putative lipoprotein [Bordetella holmesii 41130]EWM46289.1 putative lipoprotein [Bordetella holmesii 35009]AMD44857.1 hypothetical protein H558_04715 [Bordetella holmesii H558]AMD50642.1 hypothetical protein F783_013375 [Bordetella holmesii F627]